MVAAHIQDLRAAASVGMKTIYVRRLGEDPVKAGDVRDGEIVKSKDEGGEVDGVVDSFLELSEVILSIWPGTALDFLDHFITGFVQEQSVLVTLLFSF